MNIKTDKIRYSDVEFTLSLKVEKTDNGLDVEKEKFIKMCSYFGFKESDYKAKLKFPDGAEFEFIGFNPSKPKNNCNVRNIKDGKTYITNDSYIKKMMEITK